MCCNFRWEIALFRNSRRDEIVAARAAGHWRDVVNEVLDNRFGVDLKPQNHHRALGIRLLKGPRWERLFMSEVPL